MRKLSSPGVRGIREANLSRTVRLIHQTGSISRAAIGRETGLSATTVSLLVKALLESGIVQESGTGQSSGGRPPILLEFDYSYRYLLGLDMGATHLTAVLMDLAGDVLAHRAQRFDVAHDPAGTVEIALTLVEEIMFEADRSPDDLLGMGIAIPAPLEGEGLDRPSQQILPAWEGFDLTGALSEAISLPLYVENDANAGAIAEKWWGKGAEYDNLAYIKLGTGVGSGLIANGDIYRGDGGTAGEIGHVPIDLNGPLCRCGKRGCLESYVGAPALVSRVRQQRREAPREEAPVELDTIEAIIEAAHAGDDQCREVLEQAGRFLGVGISNLLNLLNPGLIVLGGELAEAGDLILDSVGTTIQARAMPKAVQETTITFSSLGADAVAVGAATVVLEHAFKPANLAKMLAG